jgi:uncharacterized protein (DUF4415 family)
MSERKRSIGSDLAKSDAHAITSAEYRESPELTKEWFAKAKPHIGGRPVSGEEWRKAAIKAGHLDAVRVGRPKSDHPKQPVNLRLDADVLAHFRATGAGWQSRINAALRKAARLPIVRAAKKAS